MRVLITTSLSEEGLRRISNAFPDVECTKSQDNVSSLSDVNLIFGGKVSPELIESAERLKWVHVRSAGVNHLPLDLLRNRGITLTNSSGAHGQPVAETILAMMFAFAIRLPALILAQQDCEWLPDDFGEGKFELAGQTLLIIGLGDLGGTLARKASAVGMHVLGARNRRVPSPDGVDELIQRDNLLAALGRSDHVALCLPDTAQTARFIGERELRAMKPTAYLYNAGRGSAISREPLIRALKEGWIAGAGLDVTDPEPLPPDDVLWTLPNVILTQHTSGTTPHNERRVIDLFLDNLGRYLRGEPLRNVVDYSLAY